MRIAGMDGKRLVWGTGVCEGWGWGRFSAVVGNVNHANVIHQPRTTNWLLYYTPWFAATSKQLDLHLSIISAAHTFSVSLRV